MITKRILASGDHHWIKGARWDECRRVHWAQVKLAALHGVDLYISTGDLYHKASTPEERVEVVSWVSAMAEVCPVVIARGNHDAPRDLAILTRLETKHPVFVEEKASVIEVAGVAVAAVAWPDRAAILAALGDDAASSTASDVAHDALRELLAGLGDELALHAGPKVLAGHFMCDGAVTSNGQPLYGQPIRVGLEDLALARADITLMGHIHKRQVWSVTGN